LNAVARTQLQTEKLLAELIKYQQVTPDPSVSPSVGPVTAGQTIKSPTSTSTKTTTNPDGSQTTETTDCYVKGTPAGSSLKLSEVCTTQVVNTSPSGSVTGTSTAVVESGQPEDSTPQEEDDFCSSLVGKLVCADMDTPDDEVPKREEVVTYQEEDVGFGAGQCPPPYTWSDSLGAHEIDLAPLCDKLTTVVRPLVILMAMLAAFFIVAPGKPEGGV